MKELITKAKMWLEYIGGVSETPPQPLPSGTVTWLLGVWWLLLIGLIILFSGQGSRFIYIDF